MSRAGAGRPVVALHLSYFTDNFGDLLLFEVYARWIREALPGAVIVAPSAPPEVAPWLAADAFGWRAAAGAGAFVYGGGGYFGPARTGTSAWQWRSARRHVPTFALGRALRRPWTINGVSVGPIGNPVFRRAAIALFRDARHATVRDQESLDQLLEWGIPPGQVRATADAVLGLDPSDIPAEARAEAAADLGDGRGLRRIGIHLPARAPDRAEQVLAMCASLLAADPAVRLVVLRDTHVGSAGPPSGSLGAAVLERFPGRASFTAYRSPWQFTGLVAALDGVVTNQLHVGIVALACGRPVLSLAAHPKTVRLYRQLGAPWRTVRLSELDGADLPDLAARALLEPPGVLVPAEVRAAALENREGLTRFFGEAFPGRGNAPRFGLSPDIGHPIA